MTMPVSGQGSGDFVETSSRIVTFHVGSRVGSHLIATPDAFTQRNPANSPASAAVSLKLTGISKVGVLGGTVAFTRPDVNNGRIGGPLAGAFQTRIKPLGLLINDANPNPFENAPGVASQRLAYYPSGTYGVRVWETQVQVAEGGASVGDPLVYTEGDGLYASINGFLTNRFQDAYEYNVAGQNDIAFCTFMGTVVQAPDGSWNEMLVFDNPF